MAFPATGTVPTTGDRSSIVEIDSPSLAPVDPASVDSGADIANRASGLAEGRGAAGSEAELRGALSGNETAFAVLETYYKDPVAAADRLSELNPSEQRELNSGNLDVLGELRPEAATQSSGGVDRDLVGPGLATYAQNRTENLSTFEATETRELDRATGREPGVDPTSPNTDLEQPTGDTGQAPSTSGQGGGLGSFMANMKNAAPSGAGGGQQREMSVEQTMQRQAMSMGANL